MRTRNSAFCRCRAVAPVSRLGSAPPTPRSRPGGPPTCRDTQPAVRVRRPARRRRRRPWRGRTAASPNESCTLASWLRSREACDRAALAWRCRPSTSSRSRLSRPPSPAQNHSQSSGTRPANHKGGSAGARRPGERGRLGVTLRDTQAARTVTAHPAFWQYLSGFSYVPLRHPRWLRPENLPHLLRWSPLRAVGMALLTFG